MITLAELAHDHPPHVCIPYKWLQGAELLLRYWAPQGCPPGERRPAIMLIHGGAWRFGTPELFYTQARYFARRGMAAFTVNYRLMGREHSADGLGLATCLADCRSALRFIRSRAGQWSIDPDRISVLGDSAGGFLAGALATATLPGDPKDDLRISGIPDAAILCNPITDLCEGDWIRSVIAGDAFTEPQPPLIPNDHQVSVARSLSPLHQVRSGQPPMLVMHGLDDRIVDPDHSRRFAAAQRAAGNRCDLELIPGARHAFILHGYTATAAQVVHATCCADRFLASIGHLSGEPDLIV